MARSRTVISWHLLVSLCDTAASTGRRPVYGRRQKANGPQGQASPASSTRAQILSSEAVRCVEDDSHRRLPEQRPSSVRRLSEAHSEGILCSILLDAEHCSQLLLPFVKDGFELKVIPGAPHGMASTLKDQINAELLAFFKGAASRAKA
jgi:hypothetical protein